MINILISVDTIWIENGLSIAELTQLAEQTIIALNYIKPIYSDINSELSLLFTTDAKMQILNKNWRQNNNATNVLSFPTLQLKVDELPGTMLGDIVFAFETINKEAIEQNKTFINHLKHLFIHGLLHLLGYDHIEDNEAKTMENLEINILNKLDIENPYQPTYGANNV